MNPGSDQPAAAELAYEAIAPAYDDFTAHHDYESWLAEMLEHLAPHGLPRRGRLLDVGCGTGKSFIPMLDREWEVQACDISPSMVELAREKVGDAAALAVADMRELPVFGEFDLVWALDDAVNYLTGDGDLERALAAMRENLAPGGLLAFDANTLLCYRTAFAAEDEVTAPGRRLTWRGRASADTEPRSVVEAVIEIQPLDTAGEPAGPAAESVHRQRHYPEVEVRAALAAAGLECLEALGHGNDGVMQRPLDEAAHTKAFYVARAAEGS